VWQAAFEKYGSDEFTIVGLALDAEGVAPAKLYYEKFGVTFPALVDPDYATQFGAVPKTFFVDEQGVVLELKDWEGQLARLGPLRPVTKEISSQWTPVGNRLDAAAIAGLSEANKTNAKDLTVATELASRYLALQLQNEARFVLQRAIEQYDAKSVARARNDDARLLGQAFFQLARSQEGDRDAQVRSASLAFYLNPTVGFGKQIARIIAPEKFDGRPDGDFDNTFREGTLRRLNEERKAWLAD